MRRKNAAHSGKEGDFQHGCRFRGQKFSPGWRGKAEAQPAMPVVPRIGFEDAWCGALEGMLEHPDPDPFLKLLDIFPGAARHHPGNQIQRIGNSLPGGLPPENIPGPFTKLTNNRGGQLHAEDDSPLERLAQDMNSRAFSTGAGQICWSPLAGGKLPSRDAATDWSHRDHRAQRIRTSSSVVSVSSVADSFQEESAALSCVSPSVASAQEDRRWQRLLHGLFLNLKRPE